MIFSFRFFFIYKIIHHKRKDRYDEEKQTGHLRNIVIRKGHYTNELMIVLVTKKK